MRRDAAAPRKCHFSVLQESLCYWCCKTNGAPPTSASAASLLSLLDSTKLETRSDDIASSYARATTVSGSAPFPLPPLPFFRFLGFSGSKKPAWLRSIAHNYLNSLNNHLQQPPGL